MQRLYGQPTSIPFEIWDADLDTGITLDSNTFSLKIGGATPIAGVLTINQTNGFVWNDGSNALGWRVETTGDEYAMYNAGTSDVWSFGTPVQSLTINGFTVKPKMLVDRAGGDSNINTILISNLDVASASPFFVWARARGSTISQSTFQALQSGDRGGVARFDGHDGTQFITAGTFEFGVDAAVSTGVVPTSFSISLMGAAGILYKDFYIDSDAEVHFASLGVDNVSVQPAGGMIVNLARKSLNLSDFIVRGASGDNLFRVDTSANQVNIGTAIQGVITSFRSTIVWLNNAKGDIDFRFDGVTTNGVFFADAALERVGIFTLVPLSGLDINNTLGLKVTETATDTTSTSNLIIGVTNTATARTITLQTADCVARRIIIVKDQSGGAGINNITIATQGAETIDGAATAVIAANYGQVTLYSNGTNWFII